MLLLHSKSQSPDPCYGRTLEVTHNGWAHLDLYPVECIGAMGIDISPWQQLNRFKSPPELEVKGNALGRADLLLDFGCEFESELEIQLIAPAPMNIYVTFGESEPEAAGLGGYGQGPWCQVHHWFIPETGLNSHRFDPVGFRFIRIQFHDLDKPATLVSVVGHGSFVASRQIGDFECEDNVFQRLWQTSAYTARACVRPDDIWDGIKRDRLGWYGDARITALTFGATFFDPRPASAMLTRLPSEEWVNGIPNFSFDAVMMLRGLMMNHGPDIPFLDDTIGRIHSMLDWVRRTQTNDEGFIIRTKAKLFFDYGFLDWSALPIGGRLEELSWLQAKYLEALRAAALISRWMNDTQRQQIYEHEAVKLEKSIVQKFWDDSCGFHHTLRRTRIGYEKYGPGWGDASYDGKTDFGPSGASRHSTATAVFAGLTGKDRNETMLKSGLIGQEQPPVITPMFLYYETEARARLGDTAGAIQQMTDYLRAMVLPNDAATIWESFEPEIQDFRRWSLNNWPKSLCHGWGSGLVPLTQRWILGLENLGPGWSTIRLHEPALSMKFRATVPTPLGLITVNRPNPDSPPEYDFPEGISVTE